MPPRSAKDEYNEESHLLIKEPLQNSLSDADEGSFWSRVSTEIVQQSLPIALPTVLSMVVTKIPFLLTIRWVGGLGTQQLASAALATTLCNVTGLSFSVGTSFALTTLAGQAKGELTSKTNDTDPEIVSGENEEPLTPLVFLFRGLMVQMALVLPIGLWWLSGTEGMLIALGQEPAVASMTATYLKILCPGLWAYSISWTLTAWVQSIGMADVPARAAILGLVFHVPFNWLFVNFLGIGYLGCAMATVCFNTIQAIYIIFSLFGTKSGRTRVLISCGGQSIGRTKLSWKPELYLAAYSLRGFLQYIYLALPGIVIISEWWASELSIFLSGRLDPVPEVALGAMTIYQSINTFCFMFPIGFSVSASTRVGNLLGEGKGRMASFASRVNLCCAACVSLVIGVMLMAAPHGFLPSLLAPREVDVIREASKTIPLLAFYVFADGIQVCLNGIIKGCGRQWITVPIVLIAYWIVGLPLAYYLAFVKNHGVFCEDSWFCGVRGLVFGMTVGTWIHMILLAVIVGLTTDWDAEAAKAKKRVASK